MVGPPKNLLDLRRIEAAVRVTCLKCGDTTLFDREAPIHDRTHHRLSLDWTAIQRDLRCWKGSCKGHETRVVAAPFSDNANELKTRRAETVLINLALEVLYRAAARSTAGAVDSVEVRLALRVLHPFLRDANLLQEYWREATEEPRKAWNSCHLPYRWIAQRLVERGYAVNAELR